MMRLRLMMVAMVVAGMSGWAIGQDAPPAGAQHGDKPAATYPEGVPPPVIMDKFTADPHAIVIGETYYIYPTVDKQNWQTTEFNVWSSKDLITWKDEGTVLDLAGKATGKEDVSWAHIRAW